MRKILVVLVLAAAAVGCGGGAQPERSQAGDAVADTQTMKEAQAAAEQVVRASGDCDAVKAAEPEALRKLDEIKGRMHTGAGQTALAALRKQVTDASQACP